MKFVFIKFIALGPNMQIVLIYLQCIYIKDTHAFYYSNSI